MKLLRHLPRFRRAQRALAELAAREQWPRGDIEQWQLERLNSIWKHAIAHVPYYRRLRAADNLPTQFENLEEFRASVPVLSRERVKASPTQFRSERPQRGKWRYSGGSTGVPTGFFWPYESYREVLRAQYRLHDMWGIDIFDRLVFLWGHAASFAPGLRGLTARWSRPLMDRLRNRVRLSAYQLGRDDLRRYLRRIQQVQPAAIYGYSTALYMLAQKARNCQIEIPSLRVAFLSAEPAHEFITETVRTAFGVPTAIEYGATECGIIAGQSTDGTLRVREDLVVVETLPRREGRHEIVLTVLANASFPLLRYAMGDVTDAPLGKPRQGFAILENVIGRQNDFIHSRSGRLIHPMLLMAMIDQSDNVARHQIHQFADGSIHVRLEPTRADQAYPVERISRSIRQAVDGFAVDVELTNQFDPNIAGKHRWVVSDFGRQPCVTTPRE